MKSNRLLRTIIILLILALNIGCDQVSKIIVRHKMQYYDQIVLLHKHIMIQRVQNSGAFLSLGDSLSGPIRIILLNIIPFIAVAFGLYFIFTKTNLNRDRKSTRLNSSHQIISYAVFCLKKKKNKKI